MAPLLLRVRHLFGSTTPGRVARRLFLRRYWLDCTCSVSLLCTSAGWLWKLSHQGGKSCWAKRLSGAAVVASWRSTALRGRASVHPIAYIGTSRTGPVLPVIPSQDCIGECVAEPLRMWNR